jgi:hypothetical protein
LDAKREKVDRKSVSIIYTLGKPILTNTPVNNNLQTIREQFKPPRVCQPWPPQVAAEKSGQQQQSTKRCDKGEKDVRYAAAARREEKYQQRAVQLY